jgi:hypothetical protein
LSTAAAAVPLRARDRGPDRVEDRFSLDGYLAARHLVITLISQEQPLIERWLQNLGHSRKAALRWRTSAR